MSWLKRLVARVAQLADRGYYVLLVAALAAADLFILVVPTEPLLVSAVLFRPKRWAPYAAIVALGSTLGAFALASVAAMQGQELLMKHFPGLSSSPDWARATDLVQRYGLGGIALVAAGPIPQHPFVLFAAVSGIRPVLIAAAVLAGRLSKYLVVSWLATRGQRFARKLKNSKGR